MHTDIVAQVDTVARRLGTLSDRGPFSLFRQAGTVASFKPTYEQPVTHDALIQLEPELLTAEVARLQNSIHHLERSNAELREFAAAEDDDESRREFEQAATENESTIGSQKERLTMIRLALEAKLGVEAGNAHYDLAGQASKLNGSRTTGSARPSGGYVDEQVSPTTATDRSSDVNGQEEPDEGMFL